MLGLLIALGALMSFVLARSDFLADHDAEIVVGGSAIASCLGMASLLIDPGPRFGSFWLALTSVYLAVTVSLVGARSTALTGDGVSTTVLVLITVGALMFMYPLFVQWSFKRAQLRRYRSESSSESPS